MNTILVIGADGFIGRKLTDHLKKIKDIKVAKMNKNIFDRSDNSIYYDMSSEFNENIFKNIKKINLVVFCAGISGYEACEKNKSYTYLINVSRTVELCKYFISKKIPLIYLSSRAVFNDEVIKPDIDAKPCPSTEYGRQKRKVEEELHILSKKYASICIILRMTKVISNATGIMEKILTAHNTGIKLKYAEDLQISPISVSYVIRSIIKIYTYVQGNELENNYYICHLSNTKSTSYYNFALEIKKILKLNLDIEKERVGPYKKLLSKNKDASLKINNLNNIFGIKAQSIKSCINDCK